MCHILSYKCIEISSYHLLPHERYISTVNWAQYFSVGYMKVKASKRVCLLSNWIFYHVFILTAIHQVQGIWLWINVCLDFYGFLSILYIWGSPGLNWPILELQDKGEHVISITKQWPVVVHTFRAGKWHSSLPLITVAQ